MMLVRVVLGVFVVRTSCFGVFLMLFFDIFRGVFAMKAVFAKSERRWFSSLVFLSFLVSRDSASAI